MRCREECNLGRRIYETAQEIKNYAEKALKPYDLTLEQFHLLKHMSATAGMSQRQLGQLVNKKPANITRILGRLESKSLIRRLDCPEDRRAIEVVLTDRGRVLLLEVLGIFDSFSAGLTRGISAQDEQTARTVLERLGVNLLSMSESPHPTPN